jgi:mRNA interferase MazF
VERLRQYEIWWAELPKPAGRRPVLLLSRDDAYSVLNKFVAAEVTTTVRGIPIEIPVGKAEGMAKRCVVNCDNLRTVSKQHLVKRISALGRRRVPEVKRAVGYALNWEELMGADDGLIH